MTRQNSTKDVKFEAAIGKVKVIVVRCLFRFCKQSCVGTLVNKLLTSKLAIRVPVGLIC